MAYPSRTEIAQSMSNSVCYKVKELIGGNVIRKGTTIVRYSGGYTTVFPFIDSSLKKVAVRCWFNDIGDAKKRSSAISEYLNKEQNPYFVNFKYVNKAILIKGELHPIVVMDWVEGKTLKKYINDNTNSETFSDLAKKFKLMVEELHRKKIAHGDLQHGNILVKSDSNLVLVDYDSMYIEQLNGMPDIIKGLPGYQHPTREKNQYVNPKLDYFSELVIYLSLLIFAEKPKLWQEYCETEDLLFSKEDFANMKKSKIYNNFISSSIPTISDLMQKLVEVLEKPDIQQLLPLEDLLVDKKKEDRRAKWNNHIQPQSQPQPQQHTIILQVSPQFVPIASIQLSKIDINLKENEKYKIKAKVLPDNATNKDLAWSSSNNSVAMVNNGIISAMKTGNAVITVRTVDGSNKSANCDVIVESLPLVESISLGRSYLTLEEKKKETLFVSVFPTTASNKNVVWSSSDTNVATVNNGTVTALKEGTAVITVTSVDGSKRYANCIVTVESILVESVSLDKSLLTLKENEYITLSATVFPSNATNKALVWSSNDNLVATVNNGRVTALKAGTTQIIAKSAMDRNKLDYCNLTVKAIAVRCSKCGTGYSDPMVDERCRKCGKQNPNLIQ